MSQKIKFDNAEPDYKFEILMEGGPVAGFSIDAARAGNNVRVAQRCFLTDYDGDFFFTLLHRCSVKASLNHYYLYIQ